MIRTRSWASLIALPVLLAGGLTYAFWSPLDRGGSSGGTAQAAVVNNDTPVTIDGQLIPLGRQLAAQLQATRDSPYTWVLTDAEDARKGMAKGTYAAVITVPPSFSARATSTAAKDPLTAQQGLLNIATSKNTGVVDSAISSAVAGSTLTVLNRQVVQTYLDNVYQGFSTIHAKTKVAADGSVKVADGTSQIDAGVVRLDAGNQSLVSGLNRLSVGAHQAAAGADTLSSSTKLLAAGAGTLSSGARQLATGTGQLADGSQQLSSGLYQLKKQTAALPKQTRALADGAQEVADGNRQLADQVVPITDTVVSAIDSLPRAGPAADQLNGVVDRCTASGADPDFCASLSQAAGVVITKANQLDAGRDRVRSEVASLGDSLTRLKTGSQQVADGAEKLAQAAPTLTAGISKVAKGGRSLNTAVKQADRGARKLSAGAVTLHSGTRQLSAGAVTLAAGNHSLARGTDQSWDGAVQLKAGSATLAKGTAALQQGADTLSDGLVKGLKQVPTYTAAQRDHLKQVAAQPMTFARNTFGQLGREASALFFVVGLWLAGLATYLRIRPVPADVTTSRRPTWRLVATAAKPGAWVTGIVAVAITVVLAPFLDLGMGSWSGFLAVALASALTLAVVNQALQAVFGYTGRFIAGAVVVLTIVPAITATAPGIFGAIYPLLPTHGAILAVRAVATGADGLLAGVIQLMIWFAIGAVSTFVVVYRRRNVPARKLRLSAYQAPPMVASI